MGCAASHGRSSPVHADAPVNGDGGDAFDVAAAGAQEEQEGDYVGDGEEVFATVGRHTLRELKPGSGQRWHIFFSHVEATGAEQSLTLKVLLEVACPNIKIWLDQDRTASESDMVTGVSSSLFFCLILTEGVMKDTDVQLQIREALKAKKPVVLIHETDARHGGVSLETCLADMPPELRSLCEQHASVGRIIAYKRATEARVTMLKALLATLGATACDDLSPLYYVPELPVNWFDRLGAVHEVVSALQDIGDEEVIVPVVGLVGPSGAGKSSLASAIVREEGTRRRFTEGVVWLSVGHGPSEAHLLHLFEVLGCALGVASAMEGGRCFTSVDDARTRLQKVIDEKPLLVVLDDVRHVADASAFVGLGIHVALLVTSQDEVVLRGLSAVACRVLPLPIKEATHLLCHVAELDDVDPERPPRELSALVEACQGLPLALAMMARVHPVGDRPRDAAHWTDLHRRLTQKLEEDAKAPEAIQPVQGKGGPHRAVGIAATQVTLDLLSDEGENGPEGEGDERQSCGLRSAYVRLGVLQGHMAAPVSVLSLLWRVEEDAVEGIVDEFADRGLMRVGYEDKDGGSVNRVVYLHELQRMHLLRALSSAGRLQEGHDVLLQGLKAQLGVKQWWEVPSASGSYTAAMSSPLASPKFSRAHGLCSYTYKSIIWHLCAAGRSQEAHALLLSLPWLQAVLKARGATGLLHDLAEWLEGHEDIEEEAGASPPKTEAASSAPGYVMGESAPTADMELELLAKAVRRSLSDLSSEGGAARLPGQLVGRLGTVVCAGMPRLAALCAQCEAWAGDTWLCPMKPTLIGPMDPCEAVLEGHTAQVSALAEDPTGRIVSGAWDGSLRVWRMVVGGAMFERCLETFAKDVLKVVTVGTTRLAGFSSKDPEVRVWDAADGLCEWFLEGHTAPILDLKSLKRGRQLLTASADKTVCVWRMTDGACEYVLEGHTGWVNVAILVPASSSLATGGKDKERGQDVVVAGSEDKTLRCWRLDAAPTLVEGESKHIAPVAVLKGHTAAVKLLVSVGGGCVVSAGGDNSLRVWDVSVLGRGDAAAAAAAGAQLAHVRVLEGHLDAVTHLEGVADGSGRVVSASRDRSVRVWDARSGACLAAATLDEPALAAVTKPRCSVTALVVVSGLGGAGVIAVGLSYGGILLLALDTGALLRALPGHSQGVTAMAVFRGTRGGPTPYASTSSGDDALTTRMSRSSASAGRGPPPPLRLISASKDRSLRVWRLEWALLPSPCHNHVGRVHALAAVTDTNGNYVLASGGDDKTIRVWPGARHTGANASGAAEGCDGKGSAAAALLAGMGPPPLVLSGHAGAVQFLLPFGKGVLISAGKDKVPRVWQWSDAPRPLSLALDGSGSPGQDKERGASGGSGGFRCIAELVGHEGDVGGMIALGDSRQQLATTSADKSIRVWRSFDWRCEHVLGPLEWRTSALGYAGGRLISGSLNGEIRVWDLANGTCAATLKGTLFLDVRVLCELPTVTAASGKEGDGGEPEGPCMVAGLEDGGVAKWDLAAGTAVASLNPFTAFIPGNTDDEIGNGNVVASTPTNARTVLGLLPVTMTEASRKGRIASRPGGSSTPPSAPVVRTRLVSTHRDGKSRVWRMDKGAEGLDRVLEVVATPGDISLAIHGAVALDGVPWVVTASEDKILRVWDVSTGHLVASIFLDHAVTAVSALPLSACADAAWAGASGRGGAAKGEALQGHVVFAASEGGEKQSGCTCAVCLPVALIMVLAGADVEDATPAVSTSALHEAVEMGSKSPAALSLVEALLSSGADPNHLVNVLEHTRTKVEELLEKARKKDGWEHARGSVDTAGEILMGWLDEAWDRTGDEGRGVGNAMEVEQGGPGGAGLEEQQGGGREQDMQLREGDGRHPGDGREGVDGRQQQQAGDQQHQPAGDQPQHQAGEQQPPGGTAQENASTGRRRPIISASMFCLLWRRLVRSVLLPADPGPFEVSLLLDSMQMRDHMRWLVEDVGSCWSPLHTAVDVGDLAMTRALLRAPDIDVNLVGRHPELRDVTPLSVAVARGHLDVMRALLDAGASTSPHQDALREAARMAGLPDKEPHPALLPVVMMAVIRRQLACLTVLVREYGVSLNLADFSNPLRHAITQHYPLAFVTALLELGADPRVGDCLSTACSHARPGNADDAAMVDLLLAWETKAGAGGGRLRPTATFRLQPFSSDMDVIKKLLAAGWDINSECNLDLWWVGTTAGTMLEHACLHLADHAASHSLALVRFLLDQGARAGLSRAILVACNSKLRSSEAGELKEGGISDQGQLTAIVTTVVRMLLAAAKLHGANPGGAAGAALPGVSRLARASAPPARGDGPSAPPPVGRTIMTRSRAAGKAGAGAAAGTGRGGRKHVGGTSTATGGVSSSRAGNSSPGASRDSGRACSHSAGGVCSYASPGLSIDTRVVDGLYRKNALIQACANGHVGAVCLLLAAGFDPNFTGGFQGPLWGGTPLLEAITHGNADVVALLLASGARTDGPLYTHEHGRRRVLNPAGVIRHLEEVAGQVWLASDSQADDDSDSGHMDCSCIYPSSPLVAAASACDASCLMLLLEAGADPNARDCIGHLALNVLGREGRKESKRGGASSKTNKGTGDMRECLLLLLKHGARADLTLDTRLGLDNSFVWTCVKEGDVDSLKLLSAHGVDLFACHGGRLHDLYHGSILEYAVSSPQTRRALPVLLAAPGANPNWTGPDGSAPPPLLSLVRRLGRGDNVNAATTAVHQLLGVGASADMTDGEGLTALHLLLLPDKYPRGEEEEEEELAVSYGVVAALLISHSKRHAEKVHCDKHGTPLELARQVAEDPGAVSPFMAMYAALGNDVGRERVAAAKRMAARMVIVLERAEEIRREARWARRKHYVLLRELAQRGRMETALAKGQPRSAYATGDDAVVCAQWMCDVAPQDVAVSIIRFL
eukprot:jgi/Mesvir1/19684/Mv09954-RA.1